MCNQELAYEKARRKSPQRYQNEELVNRQIIAVINFPKKQIGKFMSECLVLGSLGEDNDIVLLQPDFAVENGLKIG